MKILLLIFLIPCINGVHENDAQKIGLEDIERDNVLSEKRAKGEEILQMQPTQHYRPPTIHTYQSISSSDESHSNGDIGGGIIYATPSTTHLTSGQEYVQQEDNINNNEEVQAQYVTISPNHHHFHQYQKTYSATPAVHESSGTYSAPSRLSLTQPITPTIATHFQRHEQPRYVYVQAQSNKLQDSSENVANNKNVEYVSKAQPTLTYNHNEEVAQEIEENQQQQQKQEDEIYHQQQQYSNNGGNYIQYVPYVSRGPSHSKSYVMMVPIPAGYNTQTTNKHGSISSSHFKYLHSKPTPITPSTSGQYITPTKSTHIGGVQYVNSNDIHDNNSVDEQQAAQDIQYAEPNQEINHNNYDSDQSKQLQYAPKHPEQQEISKLQYLHKVIPLHQSQQQQLYTHHPAPQLVQPFHYSPPSMNFFGAFDRQAKSLLDSYIPSWVILERQRSLNQNHYANHYTPNSYNTIAYSTPHQSVHYTGSHFKRSPEKKP